MLEIMSGGTVKFVNKNIFIAGGRVGTEGVPTAGGS